MDYIIRATTADGGVRVFAANMGQCVQTAFEIHNTSPVMTAALGRCLTASAMMGCMLKSDDDIITLSIKGDGPGKGIVVTSDSKARVRGYCFENNVDIPLKKNGKLDVSGAIGNGTLTVLRDMGLKEPYVGQVPLVSGEIAEDITYYYAVSEQIPSAVSLGTLIDRDYSVKQAGGFIIQIMPDADENMIDAIENKIKTIPAITKMLEDKMTLEDILNYVLGDFKVNILDKITPKYYCSCSREKVYKALLSVGREELEDMLKKDKKAVVHCHFCNKDYEFDEQCLIDMLS